MTRRQEWTPHVVMLVLGAGIGWLTSYTYYVRSLHDSEQQAARIEQQYQQLEAMIQDGVNRGVIKAERDQQGRITRFVPLPPGNLSVH